MLLSASPSPPVVTPRKSHDIPTDMSVTTSPPGQMFTMTANEMRLFRMLLAEQNSKQTTEQKQPADKKAAPEQAKEPVNEQAQESDKEEDEPEPAQLPLPYILPPPTDHNPRITPYGHNP